MNLVYFGDGRWATKCLARLLKHGHKVLAVVLRLQPSDPGLEELAKRAEIPVRRPQKVNSPEFLAWLRELDLQLGVSMSYDQIFRREILQLAPRGFINCHAGRLPYYRGRNVINWAIINNEAEIGLTVHYIDEGIDTGDIIVQSSIPVDWHDTYGSVLERVEAAFPDLLARAVDLIEQTEVHRSAQPLGEGTYFSARVQGDEWLDWADTSLNIYNKIRAITHPGPGARTLFDNRTLIIWSARYDPSWPKYLGTPGEVVGWVPAGGVRVKTGDSTILLEHLQFADSNEPASLRIGCRLGLNLLDTIYRLQREVAELRLLMSRGESSKPNCE